MDKRYKIEITEFAVEEVVAGREWKQGADMEKTEDPKKWGYTPEIIKKKNVERTAYTQNTDELDLKAVIKAINGI